MVFLILKKYIIPRCCNRNSDNLMTTKTSTVRYSTTELSESQGPEGSFGSVGTFGSFTQVGN